MSRSLIRREPGADFKADLPETLKTIYRCRGISSASELDLSLANLEQPNKLPDIDLAARRVGEAIRNRESILIVADFDADGATSCALLICALSDMGAQHLDYLVPNRAEHGYGLSAAVAELAIDRHPQLLITVDNGISSHEGVRACRDAGLDVIITDHHLPPEELPPANYIVNPNLRDSEFASKAMAGVGVAFYLASATRASLREVNWFASEGQKEPRMASYLDLVALGTIADVVPLDYNNRILVAAGLKIIRSGLCRKGIAALLTQAERSLPGVTSSDLGFIVGPRLNAAGRLDDMGQGIECLISDDPTQAAALARQLNDLNLERRSIEADMTEQAAEMLSGILSGLNEPPMGICLHDPDWHQGVIGILASRIKDKTYRPVVIFANDHDERLRGSARSITGFHIRDALANIATQTPGLVEKFGGHAMAAGLTIARNRFEEFSRLFAREVADRINPHYLNHHLYTDGPLHDSDMNLEFARLLDIHGPWGQAFPEPVFEGRFDIIDQRILVGKHLKMKLLSSAGSVIEAIFFNCNQLQNTHGLIMAYRLSVNQYRSRESLQLVVEEIC